MRKKFTFALQALLAHRTSLEDSARSALAESACAVESAAREVDRRRREIRRREFEMPNRNGTLRAADLQLRAAHLHFLNRVLDASTHTLNRRSDELEAARDAAAAARRDRKAIEMVRDRRYAEFRAMELRAEQRDLEEANAATRSRVAPAQRSRRLG
ncbi:MAG: flagellar FliJ family protein [Candidatus Tumulicola sp.]